MQHQFFFMKMELSETSQMKATVHSEEVLIIQKKTGKQGIDKIKQLPVRMNQWRN